MKKLFFCFGLLASVLTGCTEFEEPMPVQEPESAATSPQTRAGAIQPFE